MILSSEIYLNVIDKVAEEQNGSLAITRFNRFSRLGELRLMDWLSGDIAGIQPPEPYLTLKNKEYLSFLIKPYKSQTENGKISKPLDYWLWERAAIIGSYRDELCGEEVIITGDDTPIELLLDSNMFDDRTNSFITGVKPSIKNPICKMIGKEFVFSPSDLGSIVLEYKRYPIFGNLKTVLDPVYNEEIPDIANSINYEWDTALEGVLTWFICQQYNINTREQALTQQLQIEGKTVRG